ncbi:alpha/beta fold hydrolase [Taibaiella chishuiensis]|uniref:Uncharacterized protein n=1 Tax=Taibaiella chishuiensis TaxID=1434707 RepID=A0A2P8DBV9_9BACT|nr:alpha/beta hydrolase [Taibaiella chishuiensis]PSK94696.1 hypothetical protein B0I18_101856 [Taibaiella chishuiensis]
MSIRTYCIGGFATDVRLFRDQLDHIPGTVYLPFPQPERGDSLETYALKFLPLIDQEQAFNLVGQSMGGIIVMELVRHIRPEKVILISSVKSRAEMPRWFNFLRDTRLYRLSPGPVIVAAIWLGTLFMRELTRVKGLRRLCLDMTRENGPAFLQWCTGAIMNWKGQPSPRPDIIHIHGTKDTMFPFRYVKNTLPVTGGTRLVMPDQAALITGMLCG